MGRKWGEKEGGGEGRRRNREIEENFQLYFELQFPCFSQVPAFGAEVYSPGMQVRGTGKAAQRTGAAPAKTVRLEADGENCISGGWERGRRREGKRAENKEVGGA